MNRFLPSFQIAFGGWGDKYYILWNEKSHTKSRRERRQSVLCELPIRGSRDTCHTHVARVPRWRRIRMDDRANLC